MNSGAALFVAGKADSIADGIQLAASLIDRGKATAALENALPSATSKKVPYDIR